MFIIKFCIFRRQCVIRGEISGILGTLCKRYIHSLFFFAHTWKESCEIRLAAGLFSPTIGKEKE